MSPVLTIPYKCVQTARDTTWGIERFPHAAGGSLHLPFNTSTGVHLKGTSKRSWKCSIVESFCHPGPDPATPTTIAKLPLSSNGRKDRVPDTAKFFSALVNVITVCPTWWGGKSITL
ncbi:hypothetical protein KIL84_016649 [Mauremys mutica]|uniref:Uncharacterized protein n=1 Tax=Mauremys mutica TaxID=74926 RepID=A0A9D3X4Y8_9SAUR|nr:hypothetical protein KIL84_016649 [Mauremys mutica]